MKSKKGNELIDFHIGRPDELTQGAGGEFFMIRNGEVNRRSCFCEHYMASDLSAENPARFLENLDRLLPGYSG